MFLIVVSSIALMALVVEPSRPPWRGALAAFIVLAIIATALSGIYGAVFRREHSWLVLIPTVLCVALLINEAAQRL